MMDLLNRLSSRSGDKTQESNRIVAEQCTNDPALLPQIAAGLSDKDGRVTGDCAEVMTMIAVSRAELVAPFAEKLFPVLGHKTPRCRWEAAHALAYITDLVPQQISSQLNNIHALIKNDNSIIVRDYCTDIIARYAATGPDAAQRAWPILKDTLILHEGRHAGHAVPGLEHVAMHISTVRAEMALLCAPLLEHKKTVIRKSISRFLKYMDTLQV